MEQTLRVRRLCGEGRAEVIHVRQSACSGDCHKCSGCGAAQETVVVEADNPIGARPGELVRVQSDTKNVMSAAAVFYMLPLVAFFLGYGLGAWLGQSPGLWGGIGFFAGIGGAVVFDRTVGRKNETVYTIVGYAAGDH